MRMLARILVAVTAAALGLLGFAYSNFSPLGQALPPGTPGRQIWLFGSAALLLVSSALCFLPSVVPSVLIVGGYELVWGLASTPQIISNPISFGAWYPFCEAISSLIAPGILYVAYGPNGTALRAGCISFGLTCVFYGASHFAYAEYTASMVPTWLPLPLGLAYLTGVAHIAAGLALVAGRFTRLAATLEALMMSLFGLLVWVPSFFMQPRPKWATPDGNRWSELVVNLLLATSAWLIANTVMTGRPSRIPSRPQ